MNKDDLDRLNEDIRSLKNRIELLLDDMDRKYFNRSLDDNQFDQLAERFQVLIKEFEALCRSHPDFNEEKLQKRKRQFFNDFTANISPRSYEILFDDFSIYISDKSYEILKKIFNVGKLEFEILADKAIQGGRLEVIKWLERDFPSLFQYYLNEYSSGKRVAPEGSLNKRNFIEFAIYYNIDIKKVVPYIDEPSEKFSYLSPQNVINIEDQISIMKPERLREIFVLCSSEARTNFIEKALKHHGKIPEIKALFNDVHYFDYHKRKTSGLHNHRSGALSLFIDNFHYTKEDLESALRALNEGIYSFDLPSVSFQYVRGGIIDLMRSFIRIGYIDEVSRMVNMSQSEELEAIKNEELMKMTMGSHSPSTRKRLPI